MPIKYVFITGGVMSGIGKGITTASIAKLFQFRGFKVSIMKIDPYLNIDPGTLNPIEHGECYVTENIWEFNPIKNSIQNLVKSVKIAELDQDFGTYERFIGENISPSHNITSGQIYYSTILKERAGYYLGKTVQIIPHCTNEVKERIIETAENEKLDVMLVECGGTTGDIESTLFLESFRQIRLSLPKHDTTLVHVTLVPFLSTVGQLKSKPTQHSVKTLQSIGLQPDIIVCRSEIELTEDVKTKISLFSNIQEKAVISSKDLPSIYSLPLEFEKQGLGDYICELLDLKPKLVEFNKVTNFSEWEKMAQKFMPREKNITIAMPGKYLDITDSYVSINEALKHACAHEGYNLNIKWIDTEKLILEDLKECDGILLTPGFGSRGVEGMISCAEYAMDYKIPYLGICFGAQLFYVAFCRKYLLMNDANTTEISQDTSHPVVDFLKGQEQQLGTGGTMRLGAHEIRIKKGSKLHKAYKKEVIFERFRHRFHIMDKFVKDNKNAQNLLISAKDPTGEIVNAIELTGDHWMVGTQFHPEYKSRPYEPSPLYLAFIKASIKHKHQKS